MPGPYCYDYPRPAVTVDAAIFALADDGLRVLMIRRKHDPFAGAWALPGGFLDIDEPIEDAAVRELKEETGLEEIALLSPIGVFGRPDRDPRGRTISVAHAAIVRGAPPEVRGADDADSAAWLDPEEIDGFAFDHDEIIAAALEWLGMGLDLGPVGLALLPDEFTDADVRRLFRALLDDEDRAVPWRQRLSDRAEIEPVPGKPGHFRAAVGGG